MRFLKKKIALSAQKRIQQEFILEGSQVKATVQESKNIQKPLKVKSTPEKITEKVKSTKTLVKNYGKAIASFAASPLAQPYLVSLLAKEKNIQQTEFIKYITQMKDSIEGIDTFRSLLLVKEGDDEKIAAYKKVFKGIGEVFIKYFTVNWIFSGRMQNKQVHLDFRFKILRRIMSPELFTYLK